MNLAKTTSLETALEKNYPVYVVFDSVTKEIVNWFVFGEMMAKIDAADRCAKSGPDTYDYAEWPKYVIQREQYQAHLDNVNAPWRQR